MPGIPPLKKFAAALAVVVVAGVATMILSYHPVPKPITAMQTPYKTASLRLGTATVLAEVADTPALREKGLGGRTGLEDGRGMWFVFDTDGLWAFWMKDTLIPLDMLWAAADGTIVYIAHNVRPDSYPAAFAPPAPARYVLEVPGGFAAKHGIAEGQKIVVQ
jgi:uncharacterized membrane protein (UPF0127 family)